MAEITLKSYECSDGHLPGVCMVCGSREEVELVDATLSVSFSRGRDSTVTRWIESQLPLCYDHEGHFRRIQWIGYGTTALVVLLFFSVIGGTALAVSILQARFFTFFYAPIVIVILGVVGIFVGAYLLTRDSIRTQDIDDKGVHLSNVSRKFVRAVEKFRQDHPYKVRYDDDEEDDDDDYDRRRRRRR